MLKEAFKTVAAFAQSPSGNSVADAEAIDFVRELAQAAAGGPIVLPSYPEAALRVQRVLADPNSSEGQVLRVIGGEPILAARVITLANSAAMNPSGRPAAELPTALARIGFDALRTAVIGFAIAQLRKAEAYRAIDQPMTVLWRHSTAVAGTSHVLSRRLKQFAPDTAMLAGLLCGVGKLYMLTRAYKYPALFGEADCYQSLVRDWHAHVARALLENWSMPEDIVHAVANHELVSDDVGGNTTMADVLACAETMVSLGDTPEVLQLQLLGDRAARRIGLSADNCMQLSQESADEVAALRAAL
jgi:HD-like signal output (HDOD) protein